MTQAQTVSIAEYFGALDDPRVERTKRHSLLAIITIALGGVICGADSWVEIAEFGKAKEEWFATFLDRPHGIPSHDTFGRVFAALDPEQFEACFRRWVRRRQERLARQIVAVDGKTLRRSHDRGAGKAALHLVSAWASAHRLILAPTAGADKSNELSALPEILQMLALEGCIVTIDAMGCHADSAQLIVDREAHYVLALKENQPRLYADVQALFADAQAVRPAAEVIILGRPLGKTDSPTTRRQSAAQRRTHHGRRPG